MRAGLVLCLLALTLLVTFAVDNAFAFAPCVTVKYRDRLACLDAFVCTETPQNSFAREICYDATKSYMLIELNETWYHLCAVDHPSVDNLMCSRQRS